VASPPPCGDFFVRFGFWKFGTKFFAWEAQDSLPSPPFQGRNPVGFLPSRSLFFNNFPVLSPLSKTDFFRLKPPYFSIASLVPSPCSRFFCLSANRWIPPLFFPKRPNTRSLFVFYLPPPPTILGGKFFPSLWCRDVVFFS